MDDRPFWLCKDEHCDDYITYRQDPYCLYGNEKYKNAFQVIPIEKYSFIRHELDLAITTMKQLALQKKIEIEAKQVFIQILLEEMKSAVAYLESCGLKDVDSPEYQMLQGFKKCLQ